MEQQEGDRTMVPCRLAAPRPLGPDYYRNYRDLGVGIVLTQEERDPQRMDSVDTRLIVIYEFENEDEPLVAGVMWNDKFLQQ
jgi:hypothetical protein